MLSYDQGAKMFKALGDPKRALIIDMISRGELCACMILENFKFSQSTLSHHMKLLCECGLVKSRDHGKWTYYSLDQARVNEARQFLLLITSKKEGQNNNKANNCC
jgi:ArsR family transcriptional regulator, arsenate/arsenite/antimonite-responsive transcriptional repressor